MRVIPRIVIHQCSTVGHSGDLVSVIPPRHDARIVLGVLPQPVVSFTEVVNNLPGSKHRHKTELAINNEIESILSRTESCANYCDAAEVNAISALI